MSRGRGGVLTAVAAAVLSAASVAHAALDVPGGATGPIRVVLLAPTADDPLAGRLDAELRTAGFDVARALVSTAQGIDQQVRGLIGGGARAVIVAAGQRTDVWIAAPGANRIASRQGLEVDEDSGLHAVLALRTVEFLRISLGLIVEPARTPARAAASRIVVARAPAPASPPPPRRWISAGATAGVLAVGGGAGAFAVAGLDVRAQVAGPIGLELSLVAPLTETSQGYAGGQARTSAWMAGGGVLWAPRPARRFSVEAAAGAMATVIRSRGVASANPDAPVATDLGARATFYGRAAARLRLAPRWSLCLDVFGGAILHPPAIVLDDIRVATWGPAFGAALGGAVLTF